MLQRASHESGHGRARQRRCFSDNRPVVPDGRKRELAMRHAAFGRLDRQRAEANGHSARSNLVLVGETLRLMPTEQGIWKPRQPAAACRSGQSTAPRILNVRLRTQLAATTGSNTRCAAIVPNHDAVCGHDRAIALDLVAEFPRRRVLRIVPARRPARRRSHSPTRRRWPTSRDQRTDAVQDAPCGLRPPDPGSTSGERSRFWPLPVGRR